MKHIKWAKGFTLIELMIVVAIVAILAAIAMPSYQSYTVKTRLSNVTNAVETLRVALALYYQEKGTFIPVAGISETSGGAWASLGLSSFPTVTNEVVAIDLSPCTGVCDLSDPNKIVLTLGHIKNGTIDGATITMTPEVKESQISWNNTCQQAAATYPVDSIVLNYFKCR